MPLGAARISFLAKTQVTAVAEVIRKQVGVSAVGNTQIDTAQSKFGGASALFDGTDDFIDVSFQTSILSTTETVEFWYRPGTVTGVSGIMRQTTDGGTDGFQILQINGAIYVYQEANASTVLTGGSLSVGTWYHIAVVNNAGTAALYIDGTSIDTDSSWGGTDDSSNLRIGEGSGLASPNWNSTRYDLNGHLDELRISDTARYTSGFTPSTTPFVNDDNTQLLLHMDGTDGSTTFVDDNGVRAPQSVSAEGAVVETAQSKFGGSSAYFAGAEDYLNIADGIDLGNSNATWTFECWFRLDSIQNDQYIWHNKGIIWITGPSRATNPNEVIVATAATEGSGSLSFYSTFTSVTWATGTWYHLAVTHDSGTTEVYVDGVSKGTASTNSWMFTGDTNAVMGKHKTASNLDWDGYIDEVRVSDSVRYTSGFTPSTAPFVNDDNTHLLLHMDGTNTVTDGTTFLDDNGKGRARVGLNNENQFQIDTGTYKFGGSSGQFDGSNDRVSGTMYPSIGTSEFTYEFFLNFTDSNGGGLVKIGNLGIYLRSDEKLGVYDTGTSSAPLPTTTTVLSTSTWYHIALTRDTDNYLRVYVDGVLDGTSASTYTTSIGGDIFIGELLGTIDLLGHLDEIRISDVARYTSGFTAPTEPFQNDANTKLLIHFDGTDGSLDVFDDNGVY